MPKRIFYLSARRAACDLWREPGARAVICCAAVLTFGAAAAGVIDVLAESRARATSDLAERQAWLEQGEQSPHSAAHVGLYISRPLHSLAWLDRGVDMYVGSLARLSVHERVTLDHLPIVERPVNQRLFEFSYANVLHVFVPLAIGLLVATAVAREREQGTLAWITTTGANSRPVLTGVVAGVLLPMSIVLIPPTLLAIGASAIQSDPTEAAQRFVSLAAIHLVWWVIAVLAAVSVATSRETQRHALVAVFVIWISTVFLAPPLVAGLSDATVPTPSAFELADRVARARAELPSLYQRIEEIQQRGVPTGARLRTPKGLALLEEEADHNQIADDVFAWLADIHSRQREIREVFAIVMPILAVRALSSAIGGTDVEAVRQFDRQAEHSRRTLVRVLNEAEAEFGDADAAPYLPSYLAGPAIWKNVADAVAVPAATSAWRTSMLRPLAVLAAWTVVLWFTAARAVRRWHP